MKRDDKGLSALVEWKVHLLLQRAGKQTEQAPRVMDVRTITSHLPHRGKCEVPMMHIPARVSGQQDVRGGN